MALNHNPLPSIQFIPSVNGGFRVHCVAWTPPFEEAWKLNFAGFIDKESGISGVGCILRDQNAVFKSAISTPITDFRGPIGIELEALKYGLYEAERQGVDYLEIEGEAITAMQVVLGQIRPPSPMAQQLSDKCLAVLQKFRKVRFHPIVPMANRAARKLATMVNDEGGFTRWPKDPPSKIAGTLIDDVIGFYDSIE